MQSSIAKLKQRHPRLKFKAGQRFTWSPESGEIIYKDGASGERAIWSLLHETGHALLGHHGYKADVELLRLETEAWEKAKVLGKELGVKIDEDHIQNCLDTYRDWLYKRSVCPTCSTKCLQQGDFVHYRCFNCHTVWKVSSSRFSRSYRTTKHSPATI